MTTNLVESGAPLVRADSIAETERELVRLKSGFVNTLVHDVRLPLASILALMELFDSKLSAREPFDMEDRELLFACIAKGARMRQLVDDLLEVAQQEERPLKLKVERADAGRLLEELAESARGEAALRGVEIKVQPQPATPPLRADVQQVRRALAHLLSCALAATRDGGTVTIEAQGISSTRKGDAGRRLVIINVSDTSDGIPPEELPYVFDSFWQGADQQRCGGGRNVGLAIAKRVAAAHGGNVAVRSQRGVGATYSIVLPAYTEQVETTQRTARILIVEDTPDLLALLGKLIERMGHETLTAENPARALELLKQTERIDLLLTDWAMPEVSGGELIATIKRDPRWHALPTIVLTGHDNAEQDARRAGCDRFLVKPILRDELQEAISELLAAKQT